MKKPRSARARNAKGKKNTTVKSVPIALSTTSRPRAPRLQTTSSATTVTHREYLGDVTGSTSYSILSSHAVQPGLTSYSQGQPLGSWLPNIAKQYDFYAFRRLRFHYYPSCPTTTSGLVLMAFEPNPDDPPPETFQEFRSMACSQTAALREPSVLDVTSLVMNKKLRVRSSHTNVLTNYDLGKFYLATTQAANTAATGYYEIEYVIDFFNPQFTQRDVPSTDVLLPGISCIDGIGSGTVSFDVGQTSNSTNPAAFTTYCLNPVGSPTITGNTDLIIFDIKSQTSNTISDNADIDGVRYRFRKDPVGGFSMKYPGFYRLDFTLNADCQDYSTMAIGLVRRNMSATTKELTPSANWLAGYWQTQDKSGLTVYTKTSPIYWRGFAGYGTIGNDDTGVSGSIYFSIAEIDVHDGTSPDFFTLAIGTRLISGINENNTATTTIQEETKGISSMRITFLAPLP